MTIQQLNVLHTLATWVDAPLMDQARTLPWRTACRRMPIRAQLPRTRLEQTRWLAHAAPATGARTGIRKVRAGHYSRSYSRTAFPRKPDTGRLHHSPLSAARGRRSRLLPRRWLASVWCPSEVKKLPQFGRHGSYARLRAADRRPDARRSHGLLRELLAQARGRRAGLTPVDGIRSRPVNIPRRACRWPRPAAFPLSPIKRA